MSTRDMEICDTHIPWLKKEAVSRHTPQHELRKKTPARNIELEGTLVHWLKKQVAQMCAKQV